MSTVLFLNGTIYTMDVSQPRAQALAVDLQSGRIIAVGSDDEVRRVGGRDCVLYDLRGRTMIPGFIDAHIHLLMTAYRGLRIDAALCQSEDEVAELVRIRVAQTPHGQWIEGGQWDRHRWSGANFPSKTSLDAVSPDHPVALWSKDGHLLWCNSLALQRAGIDATTPDPANGVIVRDGSGEPTGLLQEIEATSLVSRVIEPLDPVRSRDVLQQGIRELQKRGVTSIHDIESEFALSLFHELRDQGQLGIRVQMILPRQVVHQWSGTRFEENDDWVRVGGIKIFADGTLGSQTAAMLESFENNPGNYGVLALSEEEMKDTVALASQRGLMVVIHAIGDRAARVALNSIEYAQQQLAGHVGSQGQVERLRYRLEHVQLIAPHDLERMRRLGVVASIQPYHAVADRELAERYWGPRHRHAYAYQTMRRLGIPLALGSDAPVETFDPLQILYAATVRSDNIQQRPPWLPEQSLGVADALWSYTLGAAYAGSEEQYKGSLSVGKFGDAVVLRDDLFQLPQQQIMENGIQATIVGGQIVYENL